MSIIAKLENLTPRDIPPATRDMDMSKFNLCNQKRLVTLIPGHVIEELQRASSTRSQEHHFALLDELGIELICTLTGEGALLPQIAKTLNFPLNILLKWIRASSTRMQKFEFAKVAAAHAYAYLAGEVLENCLNDKQEMARAKMLSAHYTWMAKMFAPTEYSSDTQLAASGGDENVVSIVMNVGGA